MSLVLNEPPKKLGGSSFKFKDYLQAWTIRTSGKQSMILFAKQAIGNHRGRTPTESPVESKDNSNALVWRDVGIASDWVHSDGVFEVLQIVAGEGVMEEMWRYGILLVTLLACSHVSARTWELQTPIDETQPLSKILLERATVELDASVSINANPILLGQQVGLLFAKHQIPVDDILCWYNAVWRCSLFGVTHHYYAFFCAGRGKQQNGLLWHSRSPWVQAKLIGLEFSPLLNSSILQHQLPEFLKWASVWGLRSKVMYL